MMNSLLQMVTVERTYQAIDSTKIGFQCRMLRKLEGMTLKEMSSRMGISVAYLANLEKGNREWRSDLVGKANSALGEKRVERRKMRNGK